MFENFFALQNAYSEGLSLPAGDGFTLDTESLASLADIDRSVAGVTAVCDIDRSVT